MRPRPALNLDSVDLYPVGKGSDDEACLLALLREHAARTGSREAAAFLADWAHARSRFAKVSSV